jgi:uncharacterized membrane protein (DUF4010 family)
VLGSGVVAASSIAPLRTLALILALNPAVGQEAALYLLPPALAGLGTAWWLSLGRGTGRAGAVRTPDNPLRFVAAIQMTLAFQVVLYLVDWVQGPFGAHGLIGSAAVVGLTDVDAFTYSMIRLGGMGTAPVLAAKALAVSVISNTLFKCGIVLVLGRKGFRGTASAGLLAIAAAGLLALVLL